MAAGEAIIRTMMGRLLAFPALPVSILTSPRCLDASRSFSISGSPDARFQPYGPLNILSPGPYFHYPSVDQRPIAKS